MGEAAAELVQDVSTNCLEETLDGLAEKHAELDDETHIEWRTAVIGFQEALR